MSQNWVDAVAEFNKANSYEPPKHPTAHVPHEVVALRMRLMMEELGELVVAMHEKDIVEVADATCDLLYVVLGTAHAYGLSPVLDRLFKEVHASNMSKDFITNADGRKGGLKGKRYFPPNLADIIDDYADAVKKIEEITCTCKVTVDGHGDAHHQRGCPMNRHCVVCGLIMAPNGAPCTHTSSLK